MAFRGRRGRGLCRECGAWRGGGPGQRARGVDVQLYEAGAWPPGECVCVCVCLRAGTAGVVVRSVNHSTSDSSSNRNRNMIRITIIIP